GAFANAAADAKVAFVARRRADDPAAAGEPIVALSDAGRAALTTDAGAGQADEAMKAIMNQDVNAGHADRSGSFGAGFDMLIEDQCELVEDEGLIGFAGDIDGDIVQR